MTPEAYSIQQFCDVHGFSRGLFFKMMKDGRGPKVVKLGRRTIITKESAAEWRSRLEKKEDPRKTNR